MKSVLISIQPKWCELIASGKKTIEVRKTRPKLQTPFKCYIYQTKNTKGVSGFTILGRYRLSKVIGEFVCDRIEELYQCNSGYVAEKARIGRYEYFNYLAIPHDTHGGYDKKCYGWHISDLKIYDKPKEFGEFRKPCRFEKSNFICPMLCPYYEYECPESAKCLKRLTRAPQSWCYVEE